MSWENLFNRKFIVINHPTSQVSVSQRQEEKAGGFVSTINHRRAGVKNPTRDETRDLRGVGSGRLQKTEAENGARRRSREKEEYRRHESIKKTQTNEPSNLV